MRDPAIRERLRASVVLLLLSGLIVVLATRAVLLARQPEELIGIDEKKWFQAAGPVQQAGSLGEVRNGIAPGEEVWLILPPGWDPGWWGWMARYHLPEQRIAGVVQQESQAPPRAWIVTVSPEGKVRAGRNR